jgi:hypothetical protein
MLYFPLKNNRFLCFGWNDDLPPGNVHIIGSFYGSLMGLLLDFEFSDAIPVFIRISYSTSKLISLSNTCPLFRPDMTGH